MKINKNIKFFAAIFGLFAFIAIPLVAMAQISNNGLSSADQTNCANFQTQFNIQSKYITNPGALSAEDQKSLTTVVPIYCSANQLLYTAMNILFGVSAGVAILFIIVGGFWYITSAGNEEQAEKGRKTLVNSIIGLVVIIMAAVIVRIVVNALSGNSSSNTTSSSGSTSSGTTPPTPANSSGQTPAQSQASLASIVTVSPDSLPSQGTVIIIASFSSGSGLNQVLQSCDVQSVSAVAFNMADSNGSPVASAAPFINSSSAYMATINLDVDSLPNQSGTIEASVCGTPIKSFSYSKAGQ